MPLAINICKFVQPENHRYVGGLHCKGEIREAESSGAPPETSEILFVFTWHYAVGCRLIL